MWLLVIILMHVYNENEKRGRWKYKMCKPERLARLVSLSKLMLEAVTVGEIDVLTETPDMHTTKDMVHLWQDPIQLSFHIVEEKCLRPFVML